MSIVKERPILMSDEMVRAILDGRKSQTRRVVKPQPVFQGRESFGDSWKWCNGEDWFSGVTADQLTGHAGLLHEDRVRFKVGDRLWVRETFWHDVREPNECVIYAQSPVRHKYRTRGVVEPCEAGLTESYLEKHKFWRKRPSIFMPRWASRITLEITAVRVERLQEISEQDAKAEGIDYTEGFEVPYRGQYMATPELRYSFLWDSNSGKKHPWSSNPWVWVLSFKQV